MTNGTEKAMEKLAKALTASGATADKHPAKGATVIAVVHFFEDGFVVDTVRRNPTAGYSSDKLGGLCDDQIIAWMPIEA